MGSKESSDSDLIQLKEAKQPVADTVCARTRSLEWNELLQTLLFLLLAAGEILVGGGGIVGIRRGRRRR
jgi:hypothetical protein